jgi:hypothetical protein
MRHSWEKSVGKDHHGVLGPGWHCKNCVSFTGQRKKPTKKDEWLTGNCAQVIVEQVMES